MSVTSNTTSRVTMLGSGNAMCVNCYNTCFYLHTPKGGILVDGGGGNGIIRQLINAKIPFEGIRHMFVTHNHTDHILGAIWMMRKISPMIFKGKHKGPFTIYCNDVVRHALYTMGELMIPRKIFDSIGQTVILREVHDGEQVEIDDMQMTFFDIASTKVKQYGFEAKLPDNLLKSSDNAQFSECNKRLQGKIEQDSSIAKKFTHEQLEQIKNGDTPDGCTWHHHEKRGKMELVDSDVHSQTGHTGGRSIWGGGSEYR